MATSLRWRGAEFSRFTKAAMGKGLQAAGLELQRIARQKASIPNAGRPKQRTRSTSRGPKGSQYTVYPSSSRQGESPRRRTGFGQKNIVMNYLPAKPASRVGYTANARYMIYHELGIRYRSGKQRRPTIIPALRDNLTRLQMIVRDAAKRHALGGR